jgi:UDP-N-acetyl-D-mannosaminuronate dehydrogenase
MPKEFHREGDMNLTSQGVVIVVGRGEVGRPLFEILSRSFECISVDIEPVEVERPCSVMHICYPFQVPDFEGTTIRYIQKYQPPLTVINSTVCPGTTRRIQEAVGELAVAYSPVRGKHRRMESDMLRYKKFVATTRPEALERARDHFNRAGFKTATFPSPEVAELSKLLETTYLGILVGWAQEVERLASECGGTFEDVNAFIEEIDFLPSRIVPGHIGGHCVMPNIAILKRQFQSDFLDAVVRSNKLVEEEQTLEAIVGETK